MNRNAIKQETIDRTLACLKEINSKADAKGNIPWGSRSIVKRYRLPNEILGIATRLGYYDRVGKKKIRVRLEIVEPIHARKLLEARSKYQMDVRLAKKNPPVVRKPTAPKPEPKSRKKTISLFWGLFKYER